MGVVFPDTERKPRAVYDPSVFTNIADLQSAKRIILTPEKELSTDQRWERETPHVTDLIFQSMAPNEADHVLDFGCGVGRVSREILRRQKCLIVGADISPNMRALAASYVPTRDFLACDPCVIDTLGLKFDLVLAIWVLQHVTDPAFEIKRIKAAMNPNGILFVINESSNRFVPSDQGWINDGISISGLLERNFHMLNKGKLNPSVVGMDQSQRTFWASYGKD